MCIDGDLINERIGEMVGADVIVPDPFIYFNGECKVSTSLSAVHRDSSLHAFISVNNFFMIDQLIKPVWVVVRGWAKR
ncbi:hypothetical protein [Methanomethylovorans sp.]|uniref:hypothetical protein n=1 Tax=Methanomethylovorans sp. TaxID=2758717 RepID=UPI000ACB38AC|nr:hypothetical protein [Methanomethylovorans sp.]